MAFLQIWAQGSPRSAHDRLRRAERIGGEEVFDRGEPHHALRRLSRAFVGELILVRVVARLGVSFGLFAFEPRKMGANFVGRKQSPHFGDESRKLPGEGRMITGGAREIHQFLADRIVERGLAPIALSYASRGFALLDPNLMVLCRSHRLALAAIG